ARVSLAHSPNSGRPRIEYSSSEPCAFTRNGAPLAAPTGPPISTWLVNTRSAGSNARSAAAFAVRASLGLAEVLEELRLEPLVPIHDEHGQQPTRKIDGNRLRAAEVVLLRRAFLRDDDDLVSPAAPLTRERAGVDIRPGSSEQVTVPEQDAHRQQANSESGCRRSRNPASRILIARGAFLKWHFVRRLSRP